jgi:membrane protein DedA with SNARE-associated domain
LTTELPEPLPGRNNAALNRLMAGIAGVALTTAIGSAGVVAAYYPLRHAAVGVQWLLIFVLMAFESAAVHLPSEVILPVGGWLIVRDNGLGVPGVLAVAGIAALGNTAGSMLLYSAGRAGGRPLVRRWGKYFLLHETDLDRAERALRRHHVWAIFITRLIPVVRTYSGFCAGALRIPVPLFAALTFVGSLVWCLPFVVAGSQLGANWDVIEGPAKVAGVVVLVGLVALILWTSIKTLRRA